MTDIVAFELGAVERLQKLAANDATETCATGLVADAGTRNGRQRYVVRELEPVPNAAYVSRGPTHATLSPAFCIEIANRARAAGLGVMLAHTHTGAATSTSFSPIDDAGEVPLNDYFCGRIPDGHHFASLFTNSDVICRRIGARALAQVQLIGTNVLGPRDVATDQEPQARFARQVLVFGAAVQTALASLRIAIVGLGGTGSIIATELAHLGVENYLLIDPDAIEETNLNRIVGSIPSDVGIAKVDVFSERLKTINPYVRCDVAIADIVDASTARLLLDTDFIFLCTDSHASRAVVNQVAYQYLIPCIDMGVAIHAEGGNVAHVVGRVQMLSSGLACLLCAGWIDSAQVRIEMMSPEQRQADAYVVGHSIAQPAVISLNGAVASVAVTMFLSAMAALPSRARMVHYDAIRGSMTPTVMSPNPDCIVCSSKGALGRGAAWPLPTRSYAQG